MPTTWSFDGLVFFTSDGDFVSSRAEGAETSAASTIEERIARHLLSGDGATLGRFDHLACLWNASKRLSRARLLLLDAMAADDHDVAGVVQERWSWADREWRRVARSFAIRRHVAAQLGCPEEAVAAVQRRIETELVPVLHLRAFILAVALNRKSVGIHRDWIEAYRLPADAAPGIAAMHGLALAAITHIAKVPRFELLEGAATTLARRVLPPAAARELGRDFGRAAVDFAARARTEPGEAWLAWARELCAQVIEKADPDIGLYEVMSLLHVALAEKRVQQGKWLGPVYELLRRALLFDPFSEIARARIAELEGGLDQIVDESFKSLLKRVLADAAKEAEAFADSPEGLEIVRGYQRALLWEAVQRLGLDPTQEENRASVSALFSFIAERASAAGANPLTEAEVVDRWPGLRGIPLGPLNEAVVKLEGSPPLLLGLMLPARAPSTLRERIPEAMISVRLSTERPAWRSSPIWTWLGSTRDLAFKAAALVGFAAALHGALLLSVERYRDLRANRLFVETTGGDAVAAIEASTRFLEIARADDPRRAEVRDRFEDGLLQRVRALADRPAEAGRLLQHYRDAIRTLEKDAPPVAPGLAVATPEGER